MVAGSIGIQLPAKPAAAIRRTAEIVRRAVQERCGARFAVAIAEGRRPAGVERTLILETDARIGRESFSIQDGAQGDIRVIGGDVRGVLYGAGQFLRGCRFAAGGLEPGAWRGRSAPQKPFRAIYFATHFHNWYHDAPPEKLERYVEELGLWGYNAVGVWFDMHHYAGIDDPAAQDMIRRLHAVLRAANGVGLGALLIVLGNEAYATSPNALRADWTAGHDGYTRDLYHYHVELCPHKPGAMELLLKWREEVLAAFADLRLDYLAIWPYDQGGCTCAQCKPWAANGFLKIAEPLARLARRHFPDIQIVLSTWDIDYFTQGEWAGLQAAFRRRPDWVDYLMADGYLGAFPQFPLTQGAPGGLPLVCFPEISMFGTNPWGGYGANPLPARLQQYWRQIAPVMAGGAPYSEGIYEDLNKVICARFFWDAAVSAEEAVRDYIAYEFAPEAVEPVLKAVRLLEDTLERRWQGGAEQPPIRITRPEGVEAAYALIRGAETALPERARTCWRWRILHLRALIDRELLAHGGAISEAAEAAFRELTEIYHAAQAEAPVRPPSGRPGASKGASLANLGPGG